MGYRCFVSFCSRMAAIILGGMGEALHHSTITVSLDDSDDVIKIFCFRNFNRLDPEKPVLFCFHGNSSCAETFFETLKYDPQTIQVVAFDLPGCGRSKNLPESIEYSMELVGEIMRKAILSFNPVEKKTYLFGHSLGGHLLAFIDPSDNRNTLCAGAIIAGTPPLSSAADFDKAFKPDADAMKLIPLLSKEDKFTFEEAKSFIEHTGVPKKRLINLIMVAMRTDGRFRSGCLKTLANKDQVAWMSRFEDNKVAIVHAESDGVINKDYLLAFEDEPWLLSGKICCLNGSHMTPLNNADEILEIIRDLVE